MRKTYQDIVAENNLSFEVKDGEIFGLLVENGAGKTTTFRMIMGLLESDNGYILLDGQKIDYFITDKLGFICYVMAVENAVISKILPITKLNVLIPIIGGVILVNEKLSFLQIILVIIIIVLGYLLSRKVADSKKK